MSETRPVAAVIVMAAGAGTRMKSAKSKLLHEVAGKSLLSCVLGAANSLNPERLVVVVGHDREQVEQHLADIAPNVVIAVQPKRLGTGDAVRCGLEPLGEIQGEVVVANADVPLLTGETLCELVAAHRQEHNTVTVMSSVVPDPSGYGRIVRDGSQVTAIVEHRDANSEQLAIDEINSGMYVFEAETLKAGIASLQTNNDQGELYLTDIVAFARNSGGNVGAWILDDYLQAEGVNDRVQLASLNREANRRIVEQWMRDGVTIIDPATTWIHADVDLGQDVTIFPNTQLYGATSVAANANIGPDTTLTDVEVGEAATVVRTEASLSIIGSRANVGPFTYLRPGTVLGAGGKIGGFVETKNAKIGDGAKVPHLTYCGDAVVGAGANIGAGTIFANYDGVKKSVTTVGEHSFVGSNSVLLAPVHIADGVYVAGGSAITEDVLPGQLAVARGRQRNIDGWVSAKRPGSRSDEAAKRAAEERES